MPILKTDKLFGEYCGVTAAAVGKARKAGKLTKTKEGYDTTDPKNHDYAVGMTVKAKAQRGIISPHSQADKKTGDLEAQKMKADILLKQKQARKLDTQHAKDIEDLIPTDLMVVWIGYFAAGIRSNFLNIGNRVARGDTKLRNRIEKEVKRAIEKTIEEVCRSLKDRSPKILEAINGEEEK